MEFTCLYCRGSGRFRHERPKVSDHSWLQMTAGTMRCALCKGVGKIDRPVDFLMIDTGLMFCRDRDNRFLVACPEPTCVKWVDCTSFFKTRTKFEGKCSVGHDIVIGLQPAPGAKT